jgi:hypothetical protein
VGNVLLRVGKSLGNYFSNVRVFQVNEFGQIILRQLRDGWLGGSGGLSLLLVDVRVDIRFDNSSIWSTSLDLTEVFSLFGSSLFGQWADKESVS